jgi:anti-sigma factor RsiW
MFEFFRNLGQPAEEKQQETLSAYLDGELSPSESARLEETLARDSVLQQDLREMQSWQQEMRAMPKRRAPRNFTLDPARYGRPQRQPLAGAYPLLRGATAVAALMLIIALAANVFFGESSDAVMSEAAPVAMMEMATAEAAPQEAPAAETAPEAAGESIILEEALETEVEQPVPEAGEEAALLPQRTREVLPGLELLDETVESSLAEDSMAAEEEAPSADGQAAAAVEARSALETPPAPPIENSVPAPGSSGSLFTGANLLLIGLGVLFVLLFALTLAARGQR